MKKTGEIANEALDLKRSKAFSYIGHLQLFSGKKQVDMICYARDRLEG